MIKDSSINSKIEAPRRSVKPMPRLSTVNFLRQYARDYILVPEKRRPTATIIMN